LQRSSELAGDGLGDLVYIRFSPNVIRRESTIAIITLPKDDSLVAPDILSTQAVFAVTTRASMIASSNTIAYFQLSDCVSHFLDYSNAFVAECNSVFNIGKISATQAGMRDFDEDVQRAKCWEI